MKRISPTNEFKEYFKDHVHIVKRLHEHGFFAFFIGGCVRDALTGIQPNDFDIATNARPDEIKDVFLNVIDSGITFGTVTVLSDDMAYELTTFRKDARYHDFRRPSQVVFTDSLYLDILRRDFTVNIIAYDGNKILFYLSSYEDLRNRVLKTVGNAKKRFNEDALRMLRAVRFCTVKGFTIEKKTFDAIVENAHLLEHVSKERIYGELKLILLNGHDMDLLFTTGMYRHIFMYPEYLNKQADLKKNVILGFVTLFQNYPDTEAIEKEFLNLKSDNKTSKSVVSIVEHLKCDTDEKGIRKLLTVMSRRNVSFLLEYKNIPTDDFDEIVRTGYIKSVNDLDITGYDLKRLGYEGEMIKKVKEKLLNEILYTPELNKKDLLIEMVEKGMQL